MGERVALIPGFDWFIAASILVYRVHRGVHRVKKIFK